jgi:hypothetical protein
LELAGHFGLENTKNQRNMKAVLLTGCFRIVQQLLANLQFFPAGNEWKSTGKPREIQSRILLPCFADFDIFLLVPVYFSHLSSGSSEIRSFPEAGIIDLGRPARPPYNA